jgi:hypothetical protein
MDWFNKLFTVYFLFNNDALYKIISFPNYFHLLADMVFLLLRHLWRGLQVKKIFGFSQTETLWAKAK